MVLSTEIEAGETVEGDEFLGKISKDVLVDVPGCYSKGYCATWRSDRHGRAEARWRNGCHQYAL